MATLLQSIAKRLRRTTAQVLATKPLLQSTASRHGGLHRQGAVLTVSAVYLPLSCAGLRELSFGAGPDLDVERFTQDMDEGLVDGIPRAKTTICGQWLEMYALLYGNVLMDCGRKFSDYAIPHDATLTEVLVSRGDAHFPP